MIKHLVIRTIAILATSYITGVGVPLIFESADATLATTGAALLTAFVLAIINHTIKPVLDFISVPINMATFGLFSVVINTIVVLTADYFVDGFHLPSILMAIYFAVVLAVVNWLLHVFD